MNLLSLLWHLQQTDLELEDKSQRARQVDATLANDPALAAARTAHDAAQQQLAAARAQLRDRELEAQTLDAKIKTLEERLYSGRVTNPKELDGMEKDLQMHRRQRDALDDKLLAQMDAVERAQKDAEAKMRVREQAEAARAHELAQLTRERDALAARLAELNATRTQTRGTLAPEALSTYDHLRRKIGRAVAPIKRESCGLCGVATPTGLAHRAREGNELVLCPGCGRILAG